MRVNLALPRQWPIVIAEGPRVAEILPGVTLTLGELEPLPADLRAWGDQIVYAGLGRDQVRVALVKDTETETGWKLTLFGSDVIDPSTGAILERRLHAVYRFDRWGGTARLQSANVLRFDSVVKEVTAVLLGGGPDWGAGAILCVAELWAGLQLEAADETPIAEPSQPSAPLPQPFTSDF
jgi:hypothetical protein